MVRELHRPYELNVRQVSMLPGNHLPSGSSARCAEMVRCLRSNFLYTEKRPRDLLFDVFEGTLRDRSGSPSILAKLEREAAIIAAREGPNSNVYCANWSIATRALTNAMLQAGVFFTHSNHVVLAGLPARATTIVDLAPGFRDTTEAYLLFVLIDRLKDVSVHDHTALAHALFRRFDRTVSLGEMEDQFVRLLAKLHLQVALRDDGIYQSLPHARNVEPPSKAL